MPNNADNISTSTNSGPQYGSGTGGIAHVTGEGAFNFGGSDTTAPNSSSTSFKELIDSGFRKVLENIGFMRQVIERIEFKQNVAIDYLKENIERNKKIDEKIDVLQKTLSKMEDDKRKESASEEMRRREEELEKLTKPLLVSGKERIDGPQDSGGLSSWVFLALPIFAGIVSQVLQAAPVIRGFLEFIKGTEKLITGLAGTGTVASSASSMTSAGAIAASKFSTMLEGSKTGLMSSASNFAAGLVNKNLMNVVKWLGKLKWLARHLIIFDAFYTIVFAEATANDPQAVENRFMRVFGKIAGGVGGAWLIGSILGIVIGWVPWVGPIAAISTAALAGYYGTIIGEDIGRALYRWFASDLKDYSAFTPIWKRIENDLVSTMNFMIPSSSNKPTKPSDGSSSSSGLDREAQKRRDRELQEKMDAITGKPSVGGTPTPSVGSAYSGTSSSTIFDGPSKKGYSAVTPEIEGVHDRVAARSGVSVETMMAIGDIENRNRKEGSTGSYNGLYQVKGPSDLKFQEDRMTNNILYYRKIFKESFNREPQPWELYLLHQQGPNGGRAICAAVFNGDGNMKCTQAMPKWMKKLLNLNFSVDSVIRNLKGNIGYVKNGKGYSWSIYYEELMNDCLKKGVPDDQVINFLCNNLTALQVYYAFQAAIEDRMKFYSKKSEGKGRGKAPVSAGMVPTSYSPSSYSGADSGPTGNSNYQGTDIDISGYSNIPSYGSGGSNTYDTNNTRYDKTLDKNHPALDILVSLVARKGLIPPRSVVSFNDLEHAGKTKHGKGLAVDISQSGGTKQSRDALISAIKQCGREYGVDIAAEDHTGWSGSTGQHVHAYFRSRQDADTFLSNWLKRNGIKGKSPSSSSSSPEVIANNPSSGEQLMSYGFDSQKPKIIQVTQPVIVQNSDSGKGGKRNSGMSGPIPSAFNPSNRNILMDYL